MLRIRILCQPKSVIMKIIKVNAASVQPLRKYTFCEERSLEKGILLCNFVTGEVLLLEKDDFLSNTIPSALIADTLKPSCREYLLLHRFLVGNDLEDSRDVDEVRRCIKLYKAIGFKGFDHFTILTTTDCNARCNYCYEKGITRITMNDTTAKDTADYIIKNLRQCETDFTRILWFGGEPLYNDRAIDIISQKLLDAGINYSCKMFSNGLLMDEARIDKAMRLWKLKTIQITLDGTEQVYNKTKAYIGSVENAYNIVMHHIERLLEAGIKVEIRLNISEANIEDLNNLVNELGERFRNGKRPFVYPYILYQYNDRSLKKKRDRLIEACRVLTEKLKACGLREIYSDTVHDAGDLSKNFYLRDRNCMADNMNSVVIMPDGKLHSCGRINENDAWGSIYSGETKLDNCHPTESGEGSMTPLDYWSEAAPKDECRSCKLYPFCINLKRCPGIIDTCLLTHKEMLSEIVEEKITQIMEIV